MITTKHFNYQQSYVQIFILISDQALFNVSGDHFN